MIALRITANFYSSDDADFAAAALRRNTDGIASVSIHENPTGAHRDRDFAPIGFFTNLNTGNVPGVPVPDFEAFDVNEIGRTEDEPEPRSASIEVICRPSAARRVRSVLVNRGGHDIKGSSVTS